MGKVVAGHALEPVPPHGPVAAAPVVARPGYGDGLWRGHWDVVMEGHGRSPAMGEVVACVDPELLL